MKRQSKTITDRKDIEYLLNITDKDITTSFIMKNFAEFEGKSRFRPYDLVTIPPDSYGPKTARNKNKVTTTVGLWVFNKYFIERDLFNVFGYINDTLTKKSFKKINSKLSYALLEDKITLEQMKTYLMKTQKIMPFVSILSPSYTLKMLTCTSKIDKKKKELEKKYKEAIGNADEVEIEKMEKELLAFANDMLKDDPSMDSFNSGARGSFGNNFKNMFVMKGVVMNPTPNQPNNVAMSNYMDGVSKKEYDIFANSLSSGPYSRAVKTSSGGYDEKKYVAGFQHVVLDKAGSDCHTDKYLTLYLTDSNIKDYIYSYIIKGSQLIELTSDNMDEYVGKTVKLRFSSMCKSKTGICSKCAGNLFYRLGLMNVGLATPIIPSTLKNLAMKSFHDSSVKTSEMDPMKVFGLE